ncbi:GNAT family N-acetyltransferase [Parasphingorhabdus flavimaris]|uniref:GNAT family N-acetyltransferase n=1 Tax=Parasphingorhabdus flavimaris TaxID=266812 RepID=UPI0030026A76
MEVADALRLPQDVPRGHVATIITHLEMLDKPLLPPVQSNLSLERWEKPPVADYLALFRAVGEPWLWTSRLLMASIDVEEILHDPATEVHLVRDDGAAVGFIELDFRQSSQCEIGFFGLVARMNGQGHGRWMMNQALEMAWRDDIERVWLHTCTQDSPRALPFYQQNGFRIFKQQLDMMPDPRLSGHLPETAAPHVPIFS